MSAGWAGPAGKGLTPRGDKPVERVQLSRLFRCPHPNSPHSIPMASAAAVAKEHSHSVTEIQTEPSCAGGRRRGLGRLTRGSGGGGRGAPGAGGAGWRRGRCARGGRAPGPRRRHLPGQGVGAARQTPRGRRRLGARGRRSQGAAKCKQSAMISLFS